MKKLLRCTLAWLATSATTALLVPTTNGQNLETSDGLIQLRASMPDETRVGEQFTYTIEVKNTSDEVALHDIKLSQQVVEGFSVEEVTMEAKSDKGNQQDKQQEKKQNKQQDKQSDKSKQSDDSKGKSDDGKNASANKKQKSLKEMSIAQLRPGESKTITVKASADKEGQLQTCLEVVSYRPAICLTSQVVKPDLQITKEAPEKVGRCELIELFYTVKNDGTGEVGSFQVVDNLGKELATIEGESTLKFDVDGLESGETRKFVARVYAQKPGSFSSRAVAEAKDSDLNARSKETTTKVVAADLQVKVDGPSRLYGDQVAQFTAQVTNSGNFAAEDVRVQVRFPSEAALADLSEPRMNQKKQSKNSGNSEEASPTPAMKKASEQAKSSSKKEEKSESVEMDTEEFTIARLEPGQTATFEYGLRANGASDLPTEVEATYVCTVDQADEEAKARSTATSVAQASVSIVRLPALQLVVLDDEDPVANGNNVTYTVRVWNEGDAPDQKVELEAQLPEGLKFVSAEGPTEHKVDGTTISFQPVKTLEAGDSVDYKITAKGTGEGNVRFAATVSSESLKKGVKGEEPTRLFAGQASK